MSATLEAARQQARLAIEAESQGRPDEAYHRYKAAAKHALDHIRGE
jgi:hypothetical protein